MKKRIENYMRRSGLKLEVKDVIDSIERQCRASGWLSFRQIDVLRRCCIASNTGNPMGGFARSPCYGRNAPGR